MSNRVTVAAYRWTITVHVSMAFKKLGDLVVTPDGRGGTAAAGRQRHG